MALDVCGPFPISSDGNRYVLTAIDMLSGYIETKCSDSKSADAMADFLIDDIILRHSCPSEIVSDNGTEFCNSVIAYVTTKFRVFHIKTPIYHPETNGKLERSHRLLTDSQIKLSVDNPRNWDKYVRSYTCAHNTSPNYTGHSPFFLIYNRHPRFPIDTLDKDHDIYYGTETGPRKFEQIHKVFKHTRT